jgi:hypothetical protein
MLLGLKANDLALTHCTTLNPATVAGIRRLVATKSLLSAVLTHHPPRLSACQFVADGLVHVKCVPYPLRSNTV